MKLLYTIALLALLAPSLASAQRIEVGASYTKHHLNGENIWYDAHGDYPYTNDMTARGAVVGLSGDFTDRYGWRVWGINFGRTTNAAVWPDDVPYLAGDYSAPAMFEGKGQGNAYGISAGPTVSWRPTSNWQLSIEGGVLLYRAWWDEKVRVIGTTEWNQTAWAGSHTDWTLYGGAFVRYRSAFVDVRNYRKLHGYNSVFGRHALQVVAGAAFRF